MDRAFESDLGSSRAARWFVILLTALIVTALAIAIPIALLNPLNSRQAGAEVIRQALAADSVQITSNRKDPLAVNPYKSHMLFTFMVSGEKNHGQADCQADMFGPISCVVTLINGRPPDKIL